GGCCGASSFSITTGRPPRRWPASCCSCCWCRRRCGNGGKGERRPSPYPLPQAREREKTEPSPPWGRGQGEGVARQTPSRLPDRRLRLPLPSHRPAGRLQLQRLPPANGLERLFLALVRRPLARRATDLGGTPLAEDRRTLRDHRHPDRHRRRL